MKKLSCFVAFLFLIAGTLTSCSQNDSSPQATGGSGLSSNSADSRGTLPGQGKAGSMARFAISGNHLYAVDNTKLNIFDISNPGQPQKQGEMPLSFGVETIFPYGDHLFIGTMSGMYILGIQNPAAPSHVAYYQHVVSCDPVVTDGRYAYVTLSSGTSCMRAVNRLEIVDLQNLANPFLLTEYPMTNPKGLGIDGTNLFVCDDGLKLYDATDVMNLQQKQHFNIQAYDVIPDNGHLLVIGADGFYQYQYQNNSLSLLSKIPVQRPL